MALPGENIPLITLDDVLGGDEGGPTRLPSINITDSSQQQLEKTVKNVQYMTAKTKEALTSSTELSLVPIQNQPLERKKKITVKKQQTVNCKQEAKPFRLRRLISYDEYVRQTSALRRQLDSEKIQSTSFKEQLHDLRCQYDNLLFEKNKMARELDEKRLMINQLNERIKTLADSNQNLRQSLNEIAVNIKKVLQ